MTEILVVRSEAGIDDDFARRCVDGFAGQARSCRFHRGRLRAMFDLEHIFHALRGLPQHERAGKIRAVPFDFAAAVDKQNAPFTHHLRRGRTVRERRIFSNLHAGRTVIPKLRVRLLHEFGKVVLRHPFFQRLPRRFVCLERHLTREAHDRDFVRVFDCATTGRDRCSAHYFHVRYVGRTVSKDKAHRLFGTDRRGRQSARLESLCDERVRRLMLLPRIDRRIFSQWSEMRLLHGALLLELWRDEKGVAAGRDHGREQPLAQSPLHAGEIFHRGSTGQHQGVHLVRLHERTRAFQSRATFVDRNRRHFPFHRRQRLDGRWQVSRLRDVTGFRLVGARGSCAKGESGQRGGRCAEKGATVSHGITKGSGTIWHEGEQPTIRHKALVPTGARRDDVQMKEQVRFVTSQLS